MSAPLKTLVKPPRYHGQGHLSCRLPRKMQNWTLGGKKSMALEAAPKTDLHQALQTLHKEKAWRFPKRQIFFFSDLHGDPDAFAASLVASGGARKTGPHPHDFDLTDQGLRANFIIGGDCFDKGPSSLGLLRMIRLTQKKGARLRILAGNHDVRVLFGMLAVGKKQDVKNEHFFIRTGQKIIPLLQEIWADYLAPHDGLKDIPSAKHCRAALYPRESWFDDFPAVACDHLNAQQIKRELSRIEKKYQTFEQKCEKAGLSLRQVYACVQKFRALFLEKDGEFYWFYKRMRLAYQSGSFLFLHAGLDNVMARQLNTGGAKSLNRLFRDQLFKDPFDFYYGPLCNSIRTKYRRVDHPFTQKGARHLRQASISAVVHGHRNLYHGQRLALRNGVLHFECDTSLDRHTRKHEKLRGLGASVTIFDPKGYVLGLSTDHPFIKTFHPQKSLPPLKPQVLS